VLQVRHSAGFSGPTEGKLYRKNYRTYKGQ
jgi:hypothetical protein